MRTLKPLERDIQKTILEWLRLQRGVVCWRQNTGAARLPGRGGKPQLVRFSEPGAADIQGVLGPTGRFFAFEVKRPGLEPTVEQNAWGRGVTEAGGVYACVHSLDEARAAFRLMRAA